jgi:LmbE family N-acetylglucosaminyl deacetylase
VTTAGQARNAMGLLPLAGVEPILDGGTPVVLAPHPDDEVIGCGGLLMAAVREGIRPLVVFVTDGSGSHPNSRAFPRPALIDLRQREAREAAAILGIEDGRLCFLGIRDTAAPTRGAEFEAAVAAIGLLIAPERRPVIFAPWRHDPHGDHQAVHEMATALAGRGGARHLSYPVWGWTLPADRELDAAPIDGWRLALGEDRQRKLSALRAHRSQWSDLIDDDPEGFRLDDATLDAMLSDNEVFLVNP